MKLKLFAAALFLSVASFLKADGLVLNGVTTTGATGQTLASGKGVYAVDVQVWSSAGSVATINIECRSYATAPWYPCQTINNPDATGVYYSAPLAYAYRLNVTAWTSGNIFGTIIIYKSGS